MKSKIFVTLIAVFYISFLVITPTMGEIPNVRNIRNNYDKLPDENVRNIGAEVTDVTNQDDNSIEAPATIYGDFNESGSQADSGTQNTTRNNVNLYLNGPTSVTPSSGNMVTIKLGKLLTSKPNSSEDTSVECPSMWYWLLKGNDPNQYFIVGGFAVVPYSLLDVESMGVELWADGKAKSVQFLLVFKKSSEVLLKIKTDEKDVSGPTKFVGENKSFKQYLSTNARIDMFVYYHTPLAQIPPSVELIYGSTAHPAHITTKITSPMNATFKNLSVSKNSVCVNATLKNAFGNYDIANYTLNVRGPQTPKSIKELSKNITSTFINVVYEIEYEKTDGQAYQIYFVCKDNNGNTWETNATANSTFMLKQSDEYIYYVGGGIVVAIVILMATWGFYKFKKSKLQVAKKKRAPHKAKG